MNISVLFKAIDPNFFLFYGILIFMPLEPVMVHDHHPESQEYPSKLGRFSDAYL